MVTREFVLCDGCCCFIVSIVFICSWWVRRAMVARGTLPYRFLLFFGVRENVEAHIEHFFAELALLVVVDFFS